MHEVPLRGRHAPRHDEGLPLRREGLHPLEHLPLRRLDHGAGDDHIRVRLGGGRGDPVAAGDERLLHQTGLPVVLGAAVRLEVHLHDAGNASVRKAFPRGFVPEGMEEPATPTRDLQRELKDRAKAAKFRSKSASMRLKASQLEQKAARLKRRAEALDDQATALDRGNPR